MKGSNVYIELLKSRCSVMSLILFLITLCGDELNSKC